MPKWIHDRAEHLLSKNPTMDKSLAFAIATQQAHATGHTPKGYGTAEGKHEAKTKFDTPKGDEQRANPRGLDSPKMASKKDEDLEESVMSADSERDLWRLAGGVGLAGAGAAGINAPERVLGYVPMYHGTSAPVAGRVLKEGLLARMGGTGGASVEALKEYIEQSKGKVHVSPDLTVALEYAAKQKSVGNKPAILRAAIPYEQFKGNFEVDDTMPIFNGKPTAYRTSGDVGARHLSRLRPSLRIITSSLPSASEWASYAKGNPGRLGAGLGLALAAPALAYAGYKALKKGKEVDRNTADARKEYEESNLYQKRLSDTRAAGLTGLAGYAGLGSAGLAGYAAKNIDSKGLGLPVLRKAGPQMFAEHLKRNPGKLLNYAALAGVPALAYGAYAAGKAALKHHRAGKELSKEGGVGVGAGMTASQYSGPLSFGPFKMVSGIPAFRSPATTQHNPLLAPEEWAVGGEKSAGVYDSLVDPVVSRLLGVDRMYAEVPTNTLGNLEVLRQGSGDYVDPLSKSPTKEVAQRIRALVHPGKDAKLMQYYVAHKPTQTSYGKGQLYRSGPVLNPERNYLRAEALGDTGFQALRRGVGSNLPSLPSYVKQYPGRFAKGALLAALPVAALAAGAYGARRLLRHNKGEEKSAAAALGAMYPAGRLAATQRVGAPKITGVSGPSIADVSKPKGFGMPLPGAKKNAL